MSSLLKFVARCNECNKDLLEIDGTFFEKTTTKLAALKVKMSEAKALLDAIPAEEAAHLGSSVRDQFQEAHQKLEEIKGTFVENTTSGLQPVRKSFGTLINSLAGIGKKIGDAKEAKEKAERTAEKEAKEEKLQKEFEELEELKKQLQAKVAEPQEQPQPQRDAARCRWPLLVVGMGFVTIFVVLGLSGSFSSSIEQIKVDIGGRNVAKAEDAEAKIRMPKVDTSGWDVAKAEAEILKLTQKIAKPRKTSMMRKILEYARGEKHNNQVAELEKELAHVKEILKALKENTEL